MSYFIKIKSKTISNLNSLKNSGSYWHNTLILSDDLIEILQDYLRPLKINSYVVGGKDTKYPTRTLQRHLKAIIDDLFNIGLDTRDTKNRVVIHTLRHTFASHLAINGTPIFTIQKLMNHSDIKMTMRYAKLAPDSGLNAIKGLYLWLS